MNGFKGFEAKLMFVEIVLPQILKKNPMGLLFPPPPLPVSEIGEFMLTKFALKMLINILLIDKIIQATVCQF